MMRAMPARKPVEYYAIARIADGYTVYEGTNLCDAALALRPGTVSGMSGISQTIATAIAGWQAQVVKDRQARLL
jgi:hypothetical protein